MRRRAFFGIIGISVWVAAAIAVPLSAGAAVPTSTATNYAGYGGTGVSTSVAGYVKVPTLSCANNARGHLIGQNADVQLIGGGLHLVASVRTYCYGRAPVFATEFSAPRGGAQVFSAAPVGARPGDWLYLAVWTGTGHSNAQILNTTRHKAAYLTADALPNANPYVVTTTISAKANGGVLVNGTAPAGSPTIDAPIASGPVKFTGVKVDRKPLAKTPGLFRVNWVDSTNTHVLVQTGAIGGGSSFQLTFTH